MNPPLPGPALRIAVLGDFDGPHTRAWLQVFVERGHDVHAIAYYRPREEVPGATLHVLSERPGEPAQASRSVRQGALLRRAIPPSVLRLIQALRYQRSGLRRLLYSLRPDVFHAHYAVEHAFYGSFTGYRPYVVSAWGSDLLVESRRVLGRLIASWALKRADLVTGNDASLVDRAIEIGVPPERTAVVHLGIERSFLRAGSDSVNLLGDSPSSPTVISDRALEPLYNVDTVLAAFARLRQTIPAARLLVAGDGRRRANLESTVQRLDLEDSVFFLGHVSHERLAEMLARAEVYVSVPSSDSLALSNLEAMAAGAFPIVSDLPSVDGWIENGVNGLRVPPRDVDALAEAMERSLADAELRRGAAEANRAAVEARGLREANMLLMERHYYRLAGYPVPSEGGGI